LKLAKSKVLCCFLFAFFVFISFNGTQGFSNALFAPGWAEERSGRETSDEELWRGIEWKKVTCAMKQFKGNMFLGWFFFCIERSSFQVILSCCMTDERPPVGCGAYDARPSKSLVQVFLKKKLKWRTMSYSK
jgi:hypothetical protein